MDVREIRMPAGAKKTTRIINELAPRMPFRMVVAGGSGSGKTNLVVDLISRWLPWNILMVYAKHLDIPAYVALRQKIEKREQKLKRPISVWSSSLDDVIPLDELNPENAHIALFDDMVLDKKAQDKIAHFFIRGRHKNVSAIYVSQSWKQVPKMIRENCTHIILLRGNNADTLDDLYRDYGSGFKNKEDFLKFVRAGTQKPFGFVVIDDNPVLPELRYRIGWDTLVLPDNDDAK